MPGYTMQQIEKARGMDLLTYLKIYEPNELIHIAGGEYCTREHDSLKISHGKWMWWSRGFGGASAVDYLIKVKGIPFVDAVGMILGTETEQSPFFITLKQDEPVRDKAKRLLLPARSPNNDMVLGYLTGRGIDREIIKECIDRGMLYESLPYHNCIFVGFDQEGKARYGFFRATKKDRIMGDASGSDKHFSFRVAGSSTTVHVFESAIDALSYGTIRKLSGKQWDEESLLSLGGIYSSGSTQSSKRLPAALSNFLESRPDVKAIALHLDSDRAGRLASESIMRRLDRKYHIRDEPPVHGKDCNDELLFLRKRERMKGDYSR